MRKKASLIIPNKQKLLPWGSGFFCRVGLRQCAVKLVVIDKLGRGRLRNVHHGGYERQKRGK